MKNQKSFISRKDVIAGLTTFFTASYIVVVNPAVLSTPGTGMSFSGVMTATVLLCFSMTLLMGLYARLPYVVAPGMGINAFFAFTLILGKGIPWPTALGMIFWAGVLFLLISITGLREAIATLLPKLLRSSSAAGIGLLLTLIGLKNSGLIVADPATFMKLGALSPKTGLVLAGACIMAFLYEKKNPLAFLAGIFFITAGAWLAGWVSLPAQPFSAPDFQSVFLKLDIWGALQLALIPSIVTVLLTDLFDSISTFVGVSHATGLVDNDGQPTRLKEGLIVDSFATLGAGLVGTSSGTAFIESAAGIEAGGRDGKSAVVTALCFLPCFFIAPLAAAVPEYATSPVLIFVGCFMFRSIAEISFQKLEDAIPAFLTIVLIPFTFSITQGILWGILSFVGMKILVGKAKAITPMMFVLSLVAVGLLLLEHGKL
jgi:AGZA family xanthine/uracil permease-like MFS transporter